MQSKDLKQLVSWVLTCKMGKNYLVLATLVASQDFFFFNTGTVLCQVLCLFFFAFMINVRRHICTTSRVSCITTALLIFFLYYSTALRSILCTLLMLSKVTTLLALISSYYTLFLTMSFFHKLAFCLTKAVDYQSRLISEHLLKIRSTFSYLLL